MKTHFVMMGLAAATVTALVAILACAAHTVEAAPANNAPASAAQCGRDSDCKGDRICDHGQCVSPR